MLADACHLQRDASSLHGFRSASAPAPAVRRQQESRGLGCESDGAVVAQPCPRVSFFPLLVLAFPASASRAVADVQCCWLRLHRWRRRLVPVTALPPPIQTQTRGLQPPWCKCKPLAEELFLGPNITDGVVHGVALRSTRVSKPFECGGRWLRKLSS